VVLELTGSSSTIVHEPLPEDDPRQRQPDITLAKELLGWEPEVGRAEGLKITYEYFKSLPADRLKETAHYEFKKYNRA
jgi:dTDP-glucose 4,6-dehydratase